MRFPVRKHRPFPRHAFMLVSRGTHTRRNTMCSFARRSAAALLVVLLFPAAALAQAAITGVVKDASGAVLPGVSVEASSPVLIERVRSVVSDDTGQYRIVDLRP